MTDEQLHELMEAHKHYSAAAEDINLSLALRQACRNAVEEVKEIRKSVADLKVQATELWHEADKCRGRLE